MSVDYDRQWMSRSKEWLAKTCRALTKKNAELNAHLEQFKGLKFDMELNAEVKELRASLGTLEQVTIERDMYRRTLGERQDELVRARTERETALRELEELKKAR